MNREMDDENNSSFDLLRKDLSWYPLHRHQETSGIFSQVQVSFPAGQPELGIQKLSSKCLELFKTPTIPLPQDLGVQASLPVLPILLHGSRKPLASSGLAYPRGSRWSLADFPAPML